MSRNRVECFDNIFSQSRVGYDDRELFEFRILKLQEEVLKIILN